MEGWNGHPGDKFELTDLAEHHESYKHLTIHIVSWIQYAECVLPYMRIHLGGWYVHQLSA